LVGDGKELLKKLELRSPFDFIFIDADKSSYDAYYDWAIYHVRVGGVIAAHNAFRGGNILLSDMDRDIATTDNFNRRIAYDPRVISSIYPAGDGTLVAVKIS
jgi:caffeoyl-CoA O-methyltransferase